MGLPDGGVGVAFFWTGGQEKPGERDFGEGTVENRDDSWVQ